MKKILICLLSAFFSMSISSTALGATPELPRSSPAVTAEQFLEAKSILARVNEIKSMDKSSLSLNEKKQLRKEMRTAKKQLKQISGGVYIPIGALILIGIVILLLL
ncbi:MAG: hypothetical protein ABI761_08240 [Saprospiraceae bacterium]